VLFFPFCALDAFTLFDFFHIFVFVLALFGAYLIISYGYQTKKRGHPFPFGTSIIHYGSKKVKRLIVIIPATLGFASRKDIDISKIIYPYIE
jgi:hypothetical protein